jgi:putative PIN family toxin of toxin-antitoxin system
VRVLLDTNVLFSALAGSGLCLEVLSRVIQRHDPVSSEPLLDELRQVVKRKLAGAEADAFIRQYKKLAVLAEPAALPRRICRDPDDDVVLATARAGKADLIVTGDDDLLALKTHQGIRILTPRRFLESLPES